MEILPRITESCPVNSDCDHSVIFQFFFTPSLGNSK